MERLDYLLVCMMEECSEIQKLCSKSIRFGLYDFHPERNDSNLNELRQEIIDFHAVLELIEEEAMVTISQIHDRGKIGAKIRKVEKWLKMYPKNTKEKE